MEQRSNPSRGVPILPSAKRFDAGLRTRPAGPLFSPTNHLDIKDTIQGKESQIKSQRLRIHDHCVMKYDIANNIDLTTSFLKIQKSLSTIPRLKTASSTSSGQYYGDDQMHGSGDKSLPTPVEVRPVGLKQQELSTIEAFCRPSIGRQTLLLV